MSRKGAFARHAVINTMGERGGKLSTQHLLVCSKRRGVSQRSLCETHGSQHDWRMLKKIEHSTLARLWQALLARECSRQLYQILLQRLTFGFVDPWLHAIGELVRCDLKGVRCCPSACQSRGKCLDVTGGHSHLQAGLDPIAQTLTLAS